MKYKILTTASILAIMTGAFSLSCYAEDAPKPQSKTGVSPVILEKSLDLDGKTTDGVLITNIAAGEDTAIMINIQNTALGMIGHSLYNKHNAEIAKISDIIIDGDGKALMVIVEDGAFVKSDEMAAFDYTLVTQAEENGDMLVNLSEDIINGAKPFSYDKQKGMPENSYSVVKILDGRLTSDEDKGYIADIKNLWFKDGSVYRVIANVKKLFGDDGDNIVFPYENTKIIEKDENLNLHMGKKQAESFKAYARQSKTKKPE